MTAAKEGSVSEAAEQLLRAFGQRLIYNEHRSILLDTDRVAADLELAERLVIDRGGPLTLGKALKEIEALLVDESGDPTGNLATYRDYLLARIAEPPLRPPGG